MITEAIQKENPNLRELQLKTIKFGLESLLGQILKIFIYLAIFGAFSLTKDYIITALFFCSLRLLAGGYHAETYWGCFTVTLIMFVGAIAVGIQLPLNILTKIILIFISVLLMMFYAPVDHPNKPIISTKRRQRFKILSIIGVIVLGGISFLLPAHLGTTAVVAILFEAITLPIGKYTNRGGRSL